MRSPTRAAGDRAVRVGVLAFPDTPIAFRRGLLAILADEQRHLGLYIERLAAHGVGFGDQPVTGHFWNKLDHLTGPCELVCTMNLTFENANLDFAGDYRGRPRARRRRTDRRGDRPGPRRRDRPRPLRLGVAAPADRRSRCLAGVPRPCQAAAGPARARAPRFDREARRRAGFDEAFIAALEASAPTRPSGQPR